MSIEEQEEFLGALEARDFDRASKIVMEVYRRELEDEDPEEVLPPDEEEPSDDIHAQRHELVERDPVGFVEDVRATLARTRSKAVRHLAVGDAHEAVGEMSELAKGKVLLHIAMRTEPERVRAMLTRC